MLLNYNKLGVALSAAVAVTVFSLPALADDAAVRQGLEEANAAFAQRSAHDPRPIERALMALVKVEGQAQDPDLNYDVYILESRALYWKGVHQTDNDDKMATHDLGVQKAEKARALDDGYAEAYYYAGINLARWGEAKGILASLSRKGELENYMKQTLSHPTRDDQAGQTIDGYGPDRVFGRMFFKLPGIFGGSHDKSVFHLKKAYTQAKSLALNVVYYAETLNGGSREEKALARKILDELLSSDPQTYNPSRVPENVDEFDMARKLRNEIG